MSTATDTTYIINQNPNCLSDDFDDDLGNSHSFSSSSDNSSGELDTYLDERIDIPDADSVCYICMLHANIYPRV